MFETIFFNFGGGDPLSRVIIGFIMLMAFVFTVSELWIVIRYKRSLKPVEDLNEWLKSDPVNLSELGFKLEELIHSYFLSTKSIEGDKILSKEGSRYLLSANPSSLIPVLPTSPNRFIPALLTTAGVLGTFLGISLGLSDFDPGGDSKKLMSSAIILLGGMKTAFYTSLVGMFFSLLFMIWLFAMAKAREWFYFKVKSKLSSKCLMVSPVALLHNMVPANQNELIAKQLQAADSSIESNTKVVNTLNEIRESLSQFDSDLIAKQLKAAESTIISNHKVVTSLNGINESLVEFNGEKIVRSISEAIHASVSQEIAPVLTSIGDEIRTLKDIKEQNGQEIISLITAALRKDVIEPFNEHLTNNTDVIAKTSSALDTLTAELSVVMTGLGETTKTLNSFQQETLLKLQDFAASLKEILGQFESSTEDVLDRVANEIKMAIAESISGMESQREAFENSSRLASEAFVEQNKTLENIGLESSQLMNDAKENLLTGLSDIDTKVKSMSDIVQSELEHFRIEYQNNLTAFFEQQSNLLEDTLGKQRDGLASVVDDFKTVFKEENNLRENQFNTLVTHHEKQVESVKIVRELIEAVGLTNSTVFNQIEDASKTVNKQVGLLRKEYEKASEKFNAITERMPEAMDEYLNNARDSHQQFFTNFDDAAAQAHGKLAEAANLLVTAMQQIDIQMNRNEVGVG